MFLPPPPHHRMLMILICNGGHKKVKVLNTRKNSKNSLTTVGNAFLGVNELGVNQDLFF
jgi:hypothetical protein